MRRIAIISAIVTVLLPNLAAAQAPASEAGTGHPLISTFRDCPACPEMVMIRGGSFLMGSPANETGRDGNEGPQHRVTLPKFALARTEATFTQWQACVDDGGCRSNRSPEDEGFGRIDRPVINVSWKDAQEFVAWLNSKVSGQPYHLPSEAEWEYAARAGTTTPFAYGQTISSDQANYDATHVYDGGNRGVYRKKTVPVAALRAANAWGLRHMHGNVWEWTEDCWHGDYGGAPEDGSAWSSSGGGNCAYRVVRGGSWKGDPWLLRSADRDGVPPEIRDDILGFRPARTLPTP